MLLRRHRMLALLALLACKFDAGGIAEEGSGAGNTSTGGTTSFEALTSSGDPSGPHGSSTTETTDPGSVSDSDSDSDTTTGGPTASCGDGHVDAGEACDDGPNNGPSKACTPLCQVNVCGDGYPLARAEACDDGNQDDGDGCHDDCTLPKTCGNGKPDNGEACDDGNQIDTDGCIACKKAVCGDGYVQANVESCDDVSETSACNADCSLAQCGDEKLNASAGEVCDLGLKNGIYDSGCAADCKSTGLYCGDGSVHMPDEKCEPAVPPPHATCAGDCQSISCLPDRGNCDGDPANGCEIDTNTNKNHCGECDKGCLVKCEGGSCSL